MYCAIIGDICRSRDVADRQALQQKLATILDEINNVYQALIGARFIITIGDEFQGLLLNPQALTAIIFDIKRRFYPNQLRFGVGIGDISTAINPQMAIGADGSAYHLARQNIEKIKEIDNSYEQAKRDVLISHQSDPHNRMLAAVNASFILQYSVERNWTKRQRQVVDLMTDMPGTTQQQLADELGIIQSVVRRHIESSQYYAYREVSRAVDETLMAIWEARL